MIRGFLYYILVGEPIFVIVLIFMLILRVNANNADSPPIVSCPN